MPGRGESQEAGSSGNRRGRSGSLDSRSHKKRKRSHDHDYRKDSSKKHRARSPSETSYHRKHSHRGKRSHKHSGKESRDHKIDEILNWVKESRHHSRRSRERSYSFSPSRSGDSKYSKRTSHSYSRSYSTGGRKEHEISFDSNSIRSVVVPLNNQQNKDTLSDKGQDNVDALTARMNALRAEGVPKPLLGPPISEDLAPILNVFLSKSEFIKTMKVCDKYPRPSNIDQLNVPELPKDASKIIDQKAVKNDDRFRNDQRCTSALFGALGKSLDVVLTLKEKVPELVTVGDMLLDSLQMTGFIHQDFTNIRLKGFKQTVNPSYEDVVSQKPDEPGMLLGKTPIGEQMKSCDEINKLKAKFKKPDQQAQNSSKRDFRKGGEYKRKRFGREFKPRGRKREDRRTRYFSPKGTYRKTQQEFGQKQDEKKSYNFRKN